MKLVLRTSLNRTYTPYTYSLRDILVTEELTTCRVLVPIRGICKQPENQFSKTPYVKDLEKDQIVDIPWWLAGFLFSMDLQKVAVRPPAIYDRVHRDILLAEPCAVPLQRWSSFYFEISLMMDFFDFPETALTRRTLEEVSRERWWAVVTKALNVYNDASVEKRLPRSERDVFIIGREYRVLLEKWLRRGCMITHTGIAADLREKKENETKLTNRWY